MPPVLEGPSSDQHRRREADCSHQRAYKYEEPADLVHTRTAAIGKDLAEDSEARADQARRCKGQTPPDQSCGVHGLDVSHLDADGPADHCQDKCRKRPMGRFTGLFVVDQPSQK